MTKVVIIGENHHQKHTPDLEGNFINYLQRLDPGFTVIANEGNLMPVSNNNGTLQERNQQYLDALAKNTTELLKIKKKWKIDLIKLEKQLKAVESRPHETSTNSHPSLCSQGKLLESMFMSLAPKWASNEMIEIIQTYTPDSSEILKVLLSETENYDNKKYVSNRLAIISLDRAWNLARIEEMQNDHSMLTMVATQNNNTRLVSIDDMKVILEDGIENVMSKQTRAQRDKAMSTHLSQLQKTSSVICITGSNHLPGIRKNLYSQRFGSSFENLREKMPQLLTAPTFNEFRSEGQSDNDFNMAVIDSLLLQQVTFINLDSGITYDFAHSIDTGDKTTTSPPTNVCAKVHGASAPIGKNAALISAFLIPLALYSCETSFSVNLLATIATFIGIGATITMLTPEIKPASLENDAKTQLHRVAHRIAGNNNASKGPISDNKKLFGRILRNLANRGYHKALNEFLLLPAIKNEPKTVLLPGKKAPHALKIAFDRYQNTASEHVKETFSHIIISIIHFLYTQSQESQSPSIAVELIEPAEATLIKITQLKNNERLKSPATKLFQSYISAKKLIQRGFHDANFERDLTNGLIKRSTQDPRFRTFLMSIFNGPAQHSAAGTISTHTTRSRPATNSRPTTNTNSQHKARP